MRIKEVIEGITFGAIYAVFIILALVAVILGLIGVILKLPAIYFTNYHPIQEFRYEVKDVLNTIGRL